MKKIVVIDNYDSFTFNLIHYLEELNCEVTVYRNDTFYLDEIDNFDAILLSPGPGIPDEAGLLKPLIKYYAKTKNILGICLGHQAIAEVFGCKLINLKTVYHGVSSQLFVTDQTEVLFKNCPEKFDVGRYHSWIVGQDSFSNSLIVTSVDKSGTIMSFRHREYSIRGVQFHPESILTKNGKLILSNWLDTI